MVSDTPMCETMKNYYWRLITSIKGNYYFVCYYSYSLWLQTLKQTNAHSLHVVMKQHKNRVQTIDVINTKRKTSKLTR